MFLSKLIILNNKSCKYINLEPSKTEPEVLIGINDCGKSTLLKSLDVFFDEKKSLNFIREDQQKSDLSNTPFKRDDINSILKENGYPAFQEYSGDVIAIICQFELENDDVNDEFQENTKTQLKWSVAGDKINLMRLFHNPELGEQNFSGYFLLTKDYKNGENYLELWNKTAKDLTEIKKIFNITNKDVDNKNEEGRFKNIENIEAIYRKLSPLEQRWSKYNDFPKDKFFLPGYKYLDWNFSLRDLEDIATEAMNDVTNPLLQEIKVLASVKQNEAITGVNKKFEELMGDLKDELPKSIKKISSSVFFNVSQKVTDIKLQKENVDGEVHIDNQGDGVKRQIWFALLKWRSKISSSGSKRNRYIWCFDEPETHLYPSAQRQLFSTFRDMCTNEFQLIISTHSTVFIDRTKINNVNKIVLNDGYSAIKKTENVNDVFDCLGIQNSDFLFFDKFIAVEGPTEYELIPALYKLKYKKTLMEDGVQIINLKGKSQCKNNKQILENILSEFQKTEDRIYYLFDTDTGITTGLNIFTVGTFDLEDSIPNNIWIKFIKENCSIDVDETTLNTEIRKKMVNSPEKKFYKLLHNYIYSNLVENKYLPSKGSESGSMLAKCFSKKEEIPKDIDDLFTAINS